MFRSMTAYAYRSVATSIGQLTIELQSLNRKYLDVTTYLQRELSRYENDFKKLIGEQVKRGQVNVRVSLKCHEFSPVRVTPNLSLAKQMKEAWDEISNELGLVNVPFDINLLKGETGVLSYEDSLGENKEVKAEILNALQLTVNELIVLKKHEGKALFEDVEVRVNQLAEWIETISGKSDGAVNRYRQKLIDRLEEVLPGSVENEERLLREVCLFAERVDIAEEITRFRSHINLIRKVMESKDVSIGKKIEFILQEMLREANTIGSKSSDVELSHLVVDIKGELEKIREQIQNIE
jgi:uncharacterized protein (TIGR00255 family)